MSGTFFFGPQPTVASPNHQTVHTNATVTASGSTVLSGFGSNEISLVVNLSGLVAGSIPTLTYTLTEVDPGDQSTENLNVASTGPLTATGSTFIVLRNVVSDAVKVEWVITGSAASFTGVYATVVAKQNTVLYGTDPVGLAQPVFVDGSGRLGVTGVGTPGIPDGNVLTVQGDPGGTPVPVSGTVTATVDTTGLALDATLTDGTQKAVARGGAKGATTAADITGTAEGSDHQALDVQLYHGGAAVDPTQVRVLTNADTVSSEITKIGGSTAPGLGQATMTGSFPVVLPSDMGPIDVNRATSTVDTSNSTTTPLAGNATFVGSAVDISSTASISINVFSDQASAADGLKFQWSQDATNWDTSLSFNLAASTSQSYSLGPDARYFRVRYTNGASAQSIFRVQVILHPHVVRHAVIRISDPPTAEQDATVVKSVITGKTTAGGGSYIDVKVSPSGAVQVGGTVDQGTAAAPAGSWPVNITDGTNILGTPSNPIRTDTTGSTAQPVTDNGGSLTVDGSVTASPPTSTSAAPTAIASSASNVTLVSANANRKGLYIANDSDQTLYVKFGTTASLTDWTVQIMAKGFYEMPDGVVYTGRVDGVWDSANGYARITELV